jgi:acid phosphatase type 7
VPRARRASLPALTVLVALSVALGPAPPAVAAPLFTDGFESGNLGAWTATRSFQAQQAVVFAGSWAGRATSPGGSAAWAYKTLSSAQTDIYFKSHVNLLSASGSTTLLRLRTASGGNIASVKVNISGRLVLRNDVGGNTWTSTTTVPKGAWHDLQIHLRVAGALGRAEVWLNGTAVADLGRTGNFGITPVGRIQVGGSSTAHDAAFDEGVADTSFIGGPSEPPPTPTGLTHTGKTSTTVDLAWNASPGAASYTVRRGGSVVGTPAATTFRDTGLSPDTQYSYTVDACNAAGCSPQSSPHVVRTDPSGGGDPVVSAAGDIACDPADEYFNGGNGTSTRCRQKFTAPLLAGSDAVIAVGDTQYECAGTTAYALSYHPSWGAYRSITHPVLADEEYSTHGTDCGAAGPDGYFNYFGAAAHPPNGYYSVDIGAWHVVVLNSICDEVGGCGVGSPQYNWLRQDLAAYPDDQCVLAAHHHPRFASKKNPPQVDPDMLPFWNVLYAEGAEIVLSGNSHFYERFAPQTPSGARDNANGIVQFVVGTGGKSHGGLVDPGARLPNSLSGQKHDFGVLKLTLHPTTYDWEFVPEGASSFSDSGSAACH